jgi:hypothetical protein
MKLLEEKTLFSYINNRTYVHSSSIIDFIWFKIKNLSCIDESRFCCIDIRFHRILKSNAVFIVFDEYQNFSKDESLISEGTVYEGDNIVYFYFFENKKSRSIHNIKFEYSISKENFSGNYSGSCTIGASDALDYVSNIIETNKRIHKLEYAKDSTLEIINLYMKNFPINMTGYSLKKVDILIENLGKREHKDSITTLNQLNFPAFPEIRSEIAFLVKEKKA